MLGVSGGNLAMGRTSSIVDGLFGSMELLVRCQIVRILGSDVRRGMFGTLSRTVRDIAEMWDFVWPDAVGGCLELCCGSHIRHGVANGGEVAEMCEFLNFGRKGNVVASVREAEEFCVS